MNFNFLSVPKLNLGYADLSLDNFDFGKEVYEERVPEVINVKAIRAIDKYFESRFNGSPNAALNVDMHGYVSSKRDAACLKFLLSTDNFVITDEECETDGFLFDDDEIPVPKEDLLAIDGVAVLPEKLPPSDKELVDLLSSNSFANSLSENVKVVVEASTDPFMVGPIPGEVVVMHHHACMALILMPRGKVADEIFQVEHWFPKNCVGKSVGRGYKRECGTSFRFPPYSTCSQFPPGRPQFYGRVRRKLLHARSDYFPLEIRVFSYVHKNEERCSHDRIAARCSCEWFEDSCNKLGHDLIFTGAQALGFLCRVFGRSVRMGKVKPGFQYVMVLRHRVACAGGYRFVKRRVQVPLSREACGSAFIGSFPASTVVLHGAYFRLDKAPIRIESPPPKK